jgi:hypothetical protein
VRSRAALAVLMTLAGLALAGCGSDSDGSAAPQPTSSVAPAQSIGPLLPAYCEIQGLRRLITSGDVKRADLPDFVDRTEVAGTPRIVDFSQRPPAHLDRLRDRIFASPGLAGVTVDRDAQRECLRTTTDADVERTQGAPGYLAK